MARPVILRGRAVVPASGASGKEVAARRGAVPFHKCETGVSDVNGNVLSAKQPSTATASTHAKVALNGHYFRHTQKAPSTATLFDTPLEAALNGHGFSRPHRFKAPSASSATPFTSTRTYRTLVTAGARGGCASLATATTPSNATSLFAPPHTSTSGWRG